jgi:hypothetical protein
MIVVVKWYVLPQDIADKRRHITISTEVIFEGLLAQFSSNSQVLPNTLKSKENSTLALSEL